MSNWVSIIVGSILAVAGLLLSRNLASQSIAASAPSIALERSAIDPANTAAPTVAAVAGPEAAQQISSILKDGSIQFLPNTNELTNEATASLLRIGEVLAQNPASRFEIAGHTDALGNGAVNQALSVARAQAVVDFLVERGLDGQRFQTAGYGASRPIDNNRTAAGRRHNRRIEFTPITGSAP